MARRSNKKQNKKSKKNAKQQPNKTLSLTNNADPRPLPKKKVAKRKPQKRGITMHHVRSLCSVTDPFCPAAKGSKWPDGTMGNTLTEQFRGFVALGSSTNGNNGYGFAPGIPFGLISAASTTATTITWAANYTTYRAASLVATYGSTYRIVSAGVILRSTASATQAAGLVSMGTTIAPVVGAAITLGQELYQEIAVKAIQPGMEMSWISTPQGSTSHEFRQLETNAGYGGGAANPPLAWSSLVIELSNCTASVSNLLVAEWFINIEFQPGSGNSAITSLAAPNPAKSTAAETAHSTVHRTVGSFIEGGVHMVEETIAKHASAALETFMEDPLTSLAALFG